MIGLFFYNIATMIIEKFNLNIRRYVICFNNCDFFMKNTLFIVINEDLDGITITFTDFNIVTIFIKTIFNSVINDKFSRRVVIFQSLILNARKRC